MRRITSIRSSSGESLFQLCHRRKRQNSLVVRQVRWQVRHSVPQSLAPQNLGHHVAHLAYLSRREYEANIKMVGRWGTSLVVGSLFRLKSIRGRGFADIPHPQTCQSRLNAMLRLSGPDIRLRYDLAAHGKIIQ